MTWRFTRRKVDLIITNWKLWWREVSNKKVETRILELETEIMRDTPWSRIRERNSVDKAFLEIVGSGKPTGSVLKETIAVSATIWTSVGKVHHQIRLRILLCSRVSEDHRGPEVPGVRVGVVECRDGLARITSKEFEITHFAKDGIFLNACSATTWVVVVWGEVLIRTSSSWHSRRNGPKRIMTKALWDMTPPKSVLRKSTDMPKIQRVKFTKVFARHAKIWDQNPTLGYIYPCEPLDRSPNAPKFEDRSQEETGWQEQGAREAAWKLDKNVFKLKEHARAAFFSSPENRCHLASTLKLEEREFVVDSGASMHMISKKDLSEAEMDTLTKSCSPTIVITANGEVQTQEGAIVYVKELDMFLTMKVLENTPAVLSLWKLCDENGCSNEWINGLNHISLKTEIRIICNTENFVPIVVPGLSRSSLAPSTTWTPWDRRVILLHLLHPHLHQQ